MARRTSHTGLSTLGPDTHPMDIQETDEEIGITAVHNTEGERTSNPPPNIELTSTHEDGTDGEMEVQGIYNNDPESKITTLGRRQSIDNNSDRDAQKDEESSSDQYYTVKKTKDGTCRSKARIKTTTLLLSYLSTKMQYTYRIMTLNINWIESHARLQMLEEFLQRHDVHIALLHEVTNGNKLAFKGYQSTTNIGTLGRGAAILSKLNLQLHRINVYQKGSSGCILWEHLHSEHIRSFRHRKQV